MTAEAHGVNVSDAEAEGLRGRQDEGMGRDELEKLVVELEEEMFAAAEELRFEYAAKLRDEIKDLRRELQSAATSST